MQIDARGLECPVPTTRAVEAMRRARREGSREAIVVLTDDAVCAADIPHHARALGYIAASERVSDDWTITLRPQTTGA